MGTIIFAFIFGLLLGMAAIWLRYNKQLTDLEDELEDAYELLNRARKGDFTGDGKVDAADLSHFMSLFNRARRSK
jgi:Flp pilus assembly protein TadB